MDSSSDSVYITVRTLAMDLSGHRDMERNLKMLMTTDFPAQHMLKFDIRQFVFELKVNKELERLKHQVMKKLQRLPKKRPSTSKVPESKKICTALPTTVPQGLTNYRIPKKARSPTTVEPVAKTTPTILSTPSSTSVPYVYTAVWAAPRENTPPIEYESETMALLRKIREAKQKALELNNGGF